MLSVRPSGHKLALNPTDDPGRGGTLKTNGRLNDPARYVLPTVSGPLAPGRTGVASAAAGEMVAAGTLEGGNDGEGPPVDPNSPGLVNHKPSSPAASSATTTTRASDNREITPILQGWNPICCLLRWTSVKTDRMVRSDNRVGPSSRNACSRRSGSCW